MGTVAGLDGSCVSEGGAVTVVTVLFVGGG